MALKSLGSVSGGLSGSWDGRLGTLPQGRPTAEPAALPVVAQAAGKRAVMQLENFIMLPVWSVV